MEPLSSTSRARSGAARSTNPRCAAAYSARPSAVSTRTGSSPSPRRSYGEARMSSTRTSRASANASATSSAGTHGDSVYAAR